LPLLHQYGFPGTVFVVTDQIGGTNAWDLHLGLTEQPLMSEDRICTWSQQGIEFGAHTQTDADPTTLTKDEIEKEMVGSRKSLEQILGVPVTSFAYPYGCYTLEIAEIARKHFDAALTCNRGLNHIGTDLLHLHRSEVVPFQSSGDIRSITAFGCNLLFVCREAASSWARRIVGRLRRNLAGKRAPGQPAD
jgi:peptidoglycan/xylan/chitin deacetylase (PgdA/CDA1 family)